MNWINPRDRLPDVGDIVWILRIHARSGSIEPKPSAVIQICEIEKDTFGVIIAGVLTHKGTVGGWGQHSFFNYDYYDYWGQSSEKLPLRNDPDGEIIIAWAPFEGLPEWDPMTLEESIPVVKRLINESNDVKKD